MRFMIFLFAALFAGFAGAQELKPLEDYDTTKGHESYIYERCAGLLAATLERSGSFRFPLRSAFEDEISRFVSKALKKRYNSKNNDFNMTREFLGFMVLGAVDAFRTTYLLEMANVGSNSNSLFTQDHLFKNGSLLAKDMQFCMEK